MKNALFFAVLLIFISCNFIEQEGENIKILKEIAREHFADKYIVSELMRVHDISTKSKIKSFQEILYHDTEFASMIKEQVLVQEEVLDFRDQIQNRSISSVIFLAEDNILVIKEFEEIQEMNERAKQRGINARHPFYILSEPLITENKEKVLLSVHEMMGTQARGSIIVFKKRGEKWEIIYGRETGSS